MRIPSKVLSVFLAISIFATPSYAMWPTIDLANIFQNTISAIESKVQSFQAVQQTVALLEQVAQLYAIYNNALNMYKSVGNAVDSVRNFGRKWDRIKASWTQPLDWRHLDQTLGRWGIKPANDGPLAEVNDFFKTYNFEANKFQRDLNAIPGALTRDRFIRNVVRGVEQERHAGMNDDTPYRPLVLTPTQKANYMMMAADHSNGQMAQQLSQQAKLRERDREAVRQMAEENKNSTDADQTQLMVSMNQQLITQTGFMLDASDQQASVAQNAIVTSTAMREQLNAMLEQQQASANAKQVMMRREN